MSEDSTPIPPHDLTTTPHRRRPRYSGKNPRKFEEKYKELAPERYRETVAKVIASGKTPAGTHRSIMVNEILDVLAPKPEAIVVFEYPGELELAPAGWALVKRLGKGARQPTVGFFRRS